MEGIEYMNLLKPAGALIFAFIAGAIAVSCAAPSGGSSGPNTGNSANNNTSLCGPTHSMSGRKIVWQKHQCNLADTLWVDQGTVGDNGKLLGTVNVSHGALSVKYHKLSNAKLGITKDLGLMCPICDTYGVVLKAWGWPTDNPTRHPYLSGEVNFTYTANIAPKTDGAMESRLTYQRFDGTCSPFCEAKDYNNEYQFWPEDDVQIDCTWSLSAAIPDGLVTCTITKLTSKEKYTMNTSMEGPYFRLNYASVGKNALAEGPYPGFDAQVSDFVVTIFETPQ